MLRVTLLMRCPQERAYSIESVFRTIADHAPEDIEVSTVTCPHPSHGLISRFRGMLHAMRAARGADVVHMTGDSHYLILLIRRRPIVLTIHDCQFLERARGLRRFLLWLLWLRLPAWRASAITVVSEKTRSDVSKWIDIDPRKVIVVENPLSQYLERGGSFFNTSEPRFLMIGCGPHKNIERVAAALSGLPVVLEVVGNIGKQRLRQFRASGLKVEVCHDLSTLELAQAYARADILMFPSLSEGFGLPILEAQAVGRPVVTSNRPPMRDVAGAGALLVEPEDETAIRAAAMSLMSDQELRDNLVQLGFRNLARFAPEFAAARYATLWRRLAETA